MVGNIVSQYKIDDEILEKLKDNPEDMYIVSRWMYSAGKEIVDDSEYAVLERYIKSAGLLGKYTSRTWSEDECPVELLKKYDLDDAIESVVTFKDSCSIPSVTTWDDLRIYYGYNMGRTRLSLKRDGFNFHLTYIDGVFYKGNTRARRGNGLEFKNLDNMKIPKKITRKGNINVIGEATLSEENFEILKRMFPMLNLTSRRASVRTALANENAIHLLKFTAFNIQEIEDIDEEERLLKEWGFDVPNYVWVDNYSDLVIKIKEFSEMAKTFKDPTDGIVAENPSKEKQKAIRLGYWEESIFKSYVIDYEEEAGNFNDIPKLVMRRITTEKSSHVLLPITNWNRVIDYNLLPGSPVAFKLTSDSAPVIDLNSTKLLQKTYAYKFEHYRRMIDLEEESKFM